MYLLDPDNPPEFLWHFKPENVRKGVLPKRTKPWDWSMSRSSAKYHTCKAHGIKGTYFAVDCYATEQEAVDAALALLTSSRIALDRHYHKVKARLDKATGTMLDRSDELTRCRTIATSIA